jgi:FkbM family methyltransferase
MLRDIPLTRVKIACARLAYHVLRPVFGSKPRLARRSGILFELRPTEGIDFALLLMGGFQSHVTKAAQHALPPDGVAIDVGANIGSVALWLARKLPQGHVYAFEPTDATFDRLIRNTELNPELAKRVTLEKSFVSDAVGAARSVGVYARWPLAAAAGDTIHPVHGGVLEAATDTPTVTLDAYAELHGLDRLDFIKIDTDGHELEVLRGAARTFARLRPTCVFEVGGYLLDEAGQTFSDFLAFFAPLDYALTDLKTGKALTEANYRDVIPRRTTTDVLARPLTPGRRT